MSVFLLSSYERPYLSRRNRDGTYSMLASKWLGGAMVSGPTAMDAYDAIEASINEVLMGWLSTGLFDAYITRLGFVKDDWTLEDVAADPNPRFAILYEPPPEDVLVLPGLWEWPTE